MPECRQSAQIRRRQGLLARKLLLDGNALGRQARQFVLRFRDIQQTGAQFLLLDAAHALLPLQDALQPELEAAHGIQSLAVMARSLSQVSLNADFSAVAWQIGRASCRERA